MRKGFTLLELLAVLAIIGLMAGIALVFLVSSTTKSRDARREAAIKSIQSAINLYAIKNKVYPVCAQEVVIDGRTDCLSVALVAERAISGAFTDPLHSDTGGVCGGPNQFIFCYQSDGITYTLRYNLETDSVPHKSAGWQIVNP